MDFQSIALPSELRYRPYCGCKYRMIFNLSKTNNKKNQFVTLPSETLKMLLAVDIGNTRVKAAVFEQHNALQYFVFDREILIQKIAEIVNLFPKILEIVVSSVAADTEIASKFENLSIRYIDYKCRFPFVNKYKSPETLGVDRMILASGAVLSFPNQNRLIIDAGTCITYDFVDRNNVYHGGAISPGIKLRYESLHNFTAKLPLLTLDEPTNYVGNSTKESIHSGVVNGTINEIEGFINMYERDYPNFIIILTGGNGDFLAKRLKNTIFANSNFLLESLNQTFLYQSKND